VGCLLRGLRVPTENLAGSVTKDQGQTTNLQRLCCGHTHTDRHTLSLSFSHVPSCISSRMSIYNTCGMPIEFVPLFLGSIQLQFLIHLEPIQIYTLTEYDLKENFHWEGNDHISVKNLDKESLEQVSYIYQYKIYNRWYR